MTLEQAYRAVLEDLDRRENHLRGDSDADFARHKLFKDEQHRLDGLAKLDEADEILNALCTIRRDVRKRGFDV